MRFNRAVALFLLLACSPAPRSSSAEGGSENTERTSSDLGDQKSAEQAIREREASWRALITARDTAAIASFYTEDGIYAPQGNPVIRGRKSVSARWAMEIMQPVFQLERTPIRIEVSSSGDLATEVGTYRVRFGGNGKTVEGTGTYMTAWRRVNGNWQTAAYMWNRSMPER